MKRMSSIRTVLALLGVLGSTLLLSSLLHLDTQARGSPIGAIWAPLDAHAPLLVDDIHPAAGSSGAHPLLAGEDSMFFVADDGLHGRELWRTNGLAGGTALVKDAWPGPDCSGGDYECPRPLMIDGGDFYYVVLDDGEHGWELWRSDGTESGTWMVKDIFPGWQGSIAVHREQPPSMLVVGGILYLPADDGVHGTELWRSDGTEAGTYMVKHIGTDVFDPELSGFVQLNDILYFKAFTGLHGRELWRSDGTEAGTWMVKDINPDASALSGIAEDRFVQLNGALLFRANDGVHGAELWRSDGTEAGTIMVRDLNPTGNGLGDTSFSGIAVLQNQIFFGARSDASVSELWRSDGTDAGTELVKDLGSYYDMREFTAVSDLLYFTLFDSTVGEELWRSDGSESGTVVVKDIHDAGNSSSPAELTGLNGLLYFTAEDGTHGRELWQSDGTEAGTSMVADLTPDGLSGPYGLLAAGETLYFSADDGVHGRELWCLGPAAQLGGVAGVEMNDGPSIVGTGTTVTLTATVAPLSATLPMTFTWQATGVAPSTHVIVDYTDSVSFSWNDMGTKEISLQANNMVSAATATTSLLVVEGSVVDLVPGERRTLQVVEDGLMTTIEIPAGAVSEPLALVYRSVSDVVENGELLFGGRAFELAVYRDVSVVPDFQFSAPLQITVQYGHDDVSGIDQDDLKLYLWQANAWSDAATTCTPATDQVVDLVSASVTVSACRSGPFALFGPRDMAHIYLPTIRR